MTDAEILERLGIEGVFIDSGREREIGIYVTGGEKAIKAIPRAYRQGMADKERELTELRPVKDAS